MNIHAGLIRLTETQAARFSDEDIERQQDDEYKILKPIQMLKGEIFATDRPLTLYNVKELRQPPKLVEVQVIEKPSDASMETLSLSHWKTIVKALPDLPNDDYEQLKLLEVSKENPRNGLIAAFTNEDERRSNGS